MPQCAISLLLAFLVCPMLALAQSEGSAQPASTHGVRFIKHRIGNFRSEALGVADFNGDGKLDIVAGNFLYLAPEFKRVPSRPTENLRGKVAWSP